MSEVEEGPKKAVFSRTGEVPYVHGREWWGKVKGECKGKNDGEL